MLSLVTGAAGFIGLSLVRRLIAGGDQVRALTLPGDRRLPELRALDVDGRLEIVEADVTDAAAIAPHFAGVERVFHVAALVHAWQPWARFRAVNVGGTQCVARAAQAAGVGRFVHVSTSDVFGIPRHGEVLDEASPYGYWQEPYPDTKIEAEQWLWQFARESGLAVSVIYPCWVYGPGDQALFPGFAEAIRDGFLVFWQRDTRPAWVHVENLVDAIVLVSTHADAVGHGFLVHDDTSGPSLERLCARLAEVLELPFKPRHVPYAVVYAAAATLQLAWTLLPLQGAPLILTNDIKAFGYRWQFSNKRVRHLGWSPSISIDEGMDQAFAYFREHGAVAASH
ncbi:MAG: NAD-dependent epimerase/dehydratase family protein [bacterium]